MKKLILSGLTVAILFIASPLGHLNAQTPIPYPYVPWGQGRQ